MLPKSTIAGAAALLAAPVVVIAAVLIQPTLSGDASTQVTALTSHHQAMITGMTLSTIAVVLLIAGTLWLALAAAGQQGDRRHPGLAITPPGGLPDRSSPMPLYIYQAAYTPESGAAQIREPADRFEAVRPAFEAMGGKIVATRSPSITVVI